MTVDEFLASARTHEPIEEIRDDNGRMIFWTGTYVCSFIYDESRNVDDIMRLPRNPTQGTPNE